MTDPWDFCMYIYIYTYEWLMFIVPWIRFGVSFPSRWMDTESQWKKQNGEVLIVNVSCPFVGYYLDKTEGISGISEFLELFFWCCKCVFFQWPLQFLKNLSSNNINCESTYEFISFRLDGSNIENVSYGAVCFQEILTLSRTASNHI